VFRVARWRDPGALAAGFVGLTELEFPFHRDAVDDLW
jgi:hypothetical protein